MITYSNCSDISIHHLFEAFSLGFSDYFFPLTLSETEFVAHFFGPEGNSTIYSYIAFDDAHPIGLILGGVRIFDGIKTMRCGTLCLAPEYRGKGISKILFDMHKASAIKAGCKQLFLEVITENHRAVKFYKNLGYRESSILKYYSNPVASIPTPVQVPNYDIISLTYNNIKSFRENLRACHINWQCDTPYYEDSKNDVFLGVLYENQIIAAIAINQKGKINFLWVEPDFRLKGLGHHLVLQAIRQINVEKLSVTIPGNALLESFFRKLQFQKEKIEQYEMYLPLDIGLLF